MRWDVITHKGSGGQMKESGRQTALDPTRPCSLVLITCEEFESGAVLQ